jgi:acyl carrier protein
MDKDEVRKYINSIISTKLKVKFENNYNIVRDEYEKWDSLIQIELIFQIEEYYEVHLSESEIEMMNSTFEIADILMNK